ncbi:SusC/RagA family TonB-linked outer membrane protein [Portibacter lacus]|uniref:SusC/RagA family TonB-linked outer membrane protein n=1 Tax=Portibacter lacus TaxID=1099794 RepID=A0AA37SL13_9BACT|nr:TonB-dependent receptor [Portibacter lacus]GLR15469.1 SusC/RagA family TonB-linked outer membrane protein [Portibacter lacus]
MTNFYCKITYCLITISLFFAESAISQNTVKGIVKDEVGESLIGVNILSQNAGTGTISDYDGSYSISVPNNDTLIFSYLGYESQKIAVNNSTILDVVMITQASKLDEVVVVGYGTMRKSDVTGSIISIRDEALTDVKSVNVFESLQGRVPGVDISRDNGRAGSGIDILVRGERSLRANNAPLVLVDGVPYGDNVDIPSEDIESIEILKDASSTAVYGSRGANGVILITTKRGTQGKSKVNFSMYHGVSEAFSKVPVFDREGYIKAKIDAKRDIEDWETDPAIQNAFLGDEVRGVEEGIFTDWQDVVTKPGSQSSYYLGFEGGGERNSYSTSFNYFSEDGVVVADEFKRYTFRLNLDSKINSYFKVGNSTVFTFRERDGNGPNFTSAIKSSPITEAYDSLGNYIYQPNFANPRKNPLANIDDISAQRSGRFFSTFYGEVKPTKHIVFRSNFNFDLSGNRNGYMYPQKVPTEGITTSGVNLGYSSGFLWNNILSYSNDIGIHRFSGTLVHEVQSKRNERYELAGQEQLFERQLWYNLNTNASQTTFSSLNETALVSFLGRVNYTIADKYTINFSGRYDGASQLSPGNKWDFFPAASIAWRIKEESFLTNLSVISDLKLRVGFGSSGNASIDPYSTAAALNTNPLFYEFGEPGAEEGILGFRPVALASSSLKWERTQQGNIGLDFGLFNNRISGSFDIYQGYTDRLLLQDQLPPTSGFDNVYVNAGKTKSWGYEIYLQTFNVNTSNFKWNSVFSYASSKEEIVELTSGLRRDEGNLWFVGEPLSVVYDFEKTGIFQYGDESDPTFTAVGEIKVKDQDNNGVIDFDDRVILGARRPDWIGSMINTFKVYDIDLTVNLFAKWGQFIDASAYDFDPRMLDNLLAIDYWTPNNPTNSYPRLDASRAELPYESTLSYADNSYIKIKNITLGYTLPKSLISNIKVSKLRVYASARNPFIVYSSLLEGLDPERNGSTSWPLSRLWLFGVDLSF